MEELQFFWLVLSWEVVLFRNVLYRRFHCNHYTSIRYSYLINVYTIMQLKDEAFARHRGQIAQRDREIQSIQVSNVEDC